MRNRWFVLVVLLLFLISVPTEVALGEHGPVEGYCDGDKPVITHPPSNQRPWSATCYKGALTITFPAPPPPDKVKDLPPPPDFGSVVFIFINGLYASNPYQDVNPYVAKSTGRTLVPIRFITEGLGGKADWYESEQKVRITWNDKYMEMIIGKAEAIANGRKVVLDQPPVIIFDRTVVPARAVAEAFGANVQFVEDSMQVRINLEGAVCPWHICITR